MPQKRSTRRCAAVVGSVWRTCSIPLAAGSARRIVRTATQRGVAAAAKQRVWQNKQRQGGSAAACSRDRAQAAEDCRQSAAVAEHTPEHRIPQQRSARPWRCLRPPTLPRAAAASSSRCPLCQELFHPAAPDSAAAQPAPRDARPALHCLSPRFRTENRATEAALLRKSGQQAAQAELAAAQVDLRRQTWPPWLSFGLFLPAFYVHSHKRGFAIQY